MRRRVIINLWSPPRTLVCAAILACSDDTTEPAPATTGAIHVTVFTTGVDAPMTYNVFVTGAAVAVSSTGSGKTIVGQPPGEQNVRLDVPRNCQVAGDNPRPITVAIGDTASVSFSVSCTAVLGNLRVRATTTGTDIDPTGYGVRVDGFTIENRPFMHLASVASTGERTIPGVPVGDQRVTLTGLAFNCHLVGANPQTISVMPAGTVTVSFDVACAAGLPQLAFVAGTGRTQEIHISNADQTGDRAITANVFADTDPAWSPDGTRLAFTSDRDGDREIYVIDVNGSNSVRLTNSPASDDYRPAWAPDGGRIAFVSTRFGAADIFVMNADGSNVVRLTSHLASDRDPAWSPDGRSIAFTSQRDGVPEVYVMTADGATVTRLTTGGGQHPAWSPDGTTIAYVGPACPGYPFSCQPSIHVSVRMLAGRRLVSEIGERPAWSPDGRRIAFDSMSCDFYLFECTPNGVSVAMADGTDVIRTVAGHSAVWRPQASPLLPNDAPRPSMSRPRPAPSRRAAHAP